MDKSKARDSRNALSLTYIGEMMAYTLGVYFLNELVHLFSRGDYEKALPNLALAIVALILGVINRECRAALLLNERS